MFFGKARVMREKGKVCESPFSLGYEKFCFRILDFCLFVLETGFLCVDLVVLEFTL